MILCVNGILDMCQAKVEMSCLVNRRMASVDEPASRSSSSFSKGDLSMAFLTG